VDRAARRAEESAGKSRLTSVAVMAMTTSNSMSVNARLMGATRVRLIGDCKCNTVA